MAEETFEPATVSTSNNGTRTEPYALRTARSYKDELPWTDLRAMEVCMWLIQAHSMHSAALAKFHSSFGYTKSNGRYTLLRILYFARSTRLTLNEIGNEMMVSGANITYLIDQLEKEGLVVRIPYPADRRVTHVELTPAGVEACEKLVPAMADFMAQMAKGFSDEEMSLFSSFLGRFCLNAESYEVD
jgi:MarR family transcriptional regulator, 2-MHQ and catechol-resistance regulon repressor